MGGGEQKPVFDYSSMQNDQMWISNFCYFRGECLKRLAALHLVKKGFEMATQKCFGFPSRWRISPSNVLNVIPTDFVLSISRIPLRMRLNVIGDFKSVFLNFSETTF